MELETALTEFFEMRPILAQARMGTYFIIPLRYEAGALRHDRIQALGRPWDVTTMDLSETVKRLFYADDTASIGGCYRIDAEALCQALFGGETALGITGFSVSDKNGCAERLPFSFYHAYLYYFHTRVAFLCLGIGYGDMRVLRWICNLGFAESRADYHYRDAFGQEHGFVLEKQLEEVLRGWGLESFFASSSTLLLEAYVDNVAVVPQRFRSLDTIRRAAFNLHLMSPPNALAEDDSEEDVDYVYAVKTQELGTYRWGCCVSSQTISYIMANETLDIDAEMAAQAQDGLPLLLMALYEKYTCLRFAQLITAADKKSMKQLRGVKQVMLEFQAYGTVDPANISRWHNIKRIYQVVVESNRVPQAIEDVSGKLSILIEHQREIERARNDMVVSVITLFGIISILASVLSIIQILSDGSQVAWLGMISSVLLLGALLVVMAFWGRRE